MTTPHIPEPINYDPSAKMAAPEMIEVQNVAELLKTVPFEQVTVMEYNEFRRRLLPIVITASTGEFDVNAWLEEVTHPFISIRIMDKDVVRYEIPSLLDQQNTRDDGERIGDHIQELLSIRAGSVVAANRHMAAALNRTTDTSYDPIERANVLLKALNHILTDHGYPPVPLGAAPSTHAIDAPNAVSEDVIVVTGYDIP